MSRDPRNEREAHRALDTHPPGYGLADGPAEGYRISAGKAMIIGETIAHTPLWVALLVAAAAVVVMAVFSRLQPIPGAQAAPPASAPASAVQRVRVACQLDLHGRCREVRS